MTIILCNFVTRMDKGQKETLGIRVISTIFVVVALAVFKPFGLDAWQWNACAHLLALFAIGIIVCMITDGILNYIVRMPRSYDNGVGYIIRRNLWFQLINTPLVALAICLYRHFVLSDRVESNLFSWGNYLETLAIIGFCSFAIGLYWRFKFRSRYLAAELEETRLLNERLQQLQKETEQRAKAAEVALVADKSTNEQEATKALQQRVDNRQVEMVTEATLTGTTSDTVTLFISDLLYVEAIGNYVKVCRQRDGKVQTDMLRATSRQMENELKAFPMIVRCHRAFLVNLGQVEQIVSKAGSMQLLIKHCHESIPVSRSNMAQVKNAIKGV